VAGTPKHRPRGPKPKRVRWAIEGDCVRVWGNAAAKSAVREAMALADVLPKSKQGAWDTTRAGKEGMGSGRKRGRDIVAGHPVDAYQVASFFRRKAKAQREAERKGLTAAESPQIQSWLWWGGDPMWWLAEEAIRKAEQKAGRKLGRCERKANVSDPDDVRYDVEAILQELADEALVLGLSYQGDIALEEANEGCPPDDEEGDEWAELLYIAYNSPGYVVAVDTEQLVGPHWERELGFPKDAWRKLWGESPGGGMTSMAVYYLEQWLLKNNWVLVPCLGGDDPSGITAEIPVDWIVERATDVGHSRDEIMEAVEDLVGPLKPRQDHVYWSSSSGVTEVWGRPASAPTSGRKPQSSRRKERLRSLNALKRKLL